MQLVLRYAAPLLVASVAALLPQLVLVAWLDVPETADAAKQLFVVAWIVAGTAWWSQIVLAGAVAPILRTRPPIGRAFAVAVIGAARAFVPCVLALAAFVVGGLALVVPGVVVMTLLALTGAVDGDTTATRFAASAAAVRRRWGAVALALLAIVVVDLAIAGGAWLGVFQPLAPKPTPAQLAASLRMVRVVALALVAVSPIAATALAKLATPR
jgi:hypothetical protein